MTWRGSGKAERRNDGTSSAAGRHPSQAVTGDRHAMEEQEKRLRSVLGTYPTGRRRYLEVSPEEYPDVSQNRAARIAWEMGLRAEAVDNRGSWRFGETVIEEVPWD
ncbi:hypothetical protein NKH18_09320 [Streptomyces sp. M10(2022)]